MTDEPVRTKIRTADGWLDFQDYFVRRHFADPVLELRFEGVDAARPTAAVTDAVAAAELIVIAPSNPFVSVGPILAVPGLLDAFLAAGGRVVAVSPLLGGATVRGPAADMLASLAHDEGSAGVARYYASRYRGLIDEFVIDTSDAAELEAVNAAGIGGRVENTVLAAADDRRRLAERLIG
jgi:LPPG:FO 2-phospho-L-lactate transferase